VETDLAGMSKVNITDDNLSDSTKVFDSDVLGVPDELGNYIYRGSNDTGITRSFDPDTEFIRKVLVTELPDKPLEENQFMSDFLTTLQDLERLLEKIKESLPEYMEVVYNGKTHVISKDSPYIVVKKSQEQMNQDIAATAALAEESFNSNTPQEVAEPLPQDQGTETSASVGSVPEEPGLENNPPSVESVPTELPQPQTQNM
jgi:hypothetical protein